MCFSFIIVVSRYEAIEHSQIITKMGRRLVRFFGGLVPPISRFCKASPCLCPYDDDQVIIVKTRLC